MHSHVALELASSGVKFVERDVAPLLLLLAVAAAGAELEGGRSASAPPPAAAGGEGDRSGTNRQMCMFLMPFPQKRR